MGVGHLGLEAGCATEGMRSGGHREAELAAKSAS